MDVFNGILFIFVADNYEILCEISVIIHIIKHDSEIVIVGVFYETRMYICAGFGNFPGEIEIIE